MPDNKVIHLTPAKQEEQETLTLDILKKLSLTTSVSSDKASSDKTNSETGEDTTRTTRTIRPGENFIELMDWTVENFKQHLTDQDNLNKLVQNRIVIDGQFFKFCQENGIEVNTLYKDSIISWKTEHNFEKFFVQGVFLIKSKDTEFIHCALFHKGNQYEDEISFFIIVSERNYLSYISLRNQFDDWIQKRDRSNLYIRVVDGEDIPYTKDSSWDDLYLPDEMKLDIKNLVENFLASQEFYLKNKIPWKRGLFFYGKPGNGKTSIIRTLISNYDFKPVTIAKGAGDEALREAFAYAEEQSPSLLFFEDLDTSLEKNIDASSFLNLMDGLSAKNGILVVATANEIKKLKSNIIDRPQRFDRKFEIPLPSSEMVYIYLKRWFGDTLSEGKYKELVKHAVKHEFSYAYLKELYISSVFSALSNKKDINEADVEVSLKNLIKDKNLLNKAVSTNKYFDES